MNMIAHQHEGVDGNLVFGGRVLEERQIGRVIPFAVKTCLPVVTALDHMPGAIGKIKVGQAGHVVPP
jgi:hypothetical protein